MLKLSSTRFRNALLSRIPAEDLRRLERSLTHVALPQRMKLVRPDEPITLCYFVESGVASVTTATVEGKQAEVGIIGSEGMVDVAVVLGKLSTPFEVFIQIPGEAYAAPAGDVAALAQESAEFRAVMLDFAHSFTVQMSQTLLATLTLTLDGRLSRWLLMSCDRSLSDSFPMTHEFLSLMLGVRRAGVTDSLNRLVVAGLIKTKRGEITILDRNGLEKRAGQCYVAPA